MSRPRRYAVVSAVVALIAAVLSSAAMAAATAAAASAHPATISLRQTSLGKVLVNAHGFTLYEFSRDGRRRDRCVMTSGCTQVWPMVTTHGRPRAEHGVRRSMLGSIKVGGVTQVTYGGHPLYSYTGDSSPGATSYAGVSQFGGVWRAVKASGQTSG